MSRVSEIICILEGIYACTLFLMMTLFSIKLADPKLGKYLIRAIKVRIYLSIFPGWFSWTYSKIILHRGGKGAGDSSDFSKH